VSDGEDPDRVGRTEVDDLIRKVFDRGLARSQVCRDVLDRRANSGDLAYPFSCELDFVKEPLT
jgi:hypothetical protein